MASPYQVGNVVVITQICGNLLRRNLVAEADFSMFIKFTSEKLILP